MNRLLVGAVLFLIPAAAMEATGSGAPMTPVDEEPRPQGRNYLEGAQRGAADAPGGASPEGSAGKGAQTQPDEKPSSGPRSR